MDTKRFRASGALLTLLPVFLLGACTGGEGEKAPSSQPAAPAQTKPEASEAAMPDAGMPAVAADEAAAEVKDAAESVEASALEGERRYASGFETLETEFDLSALDGATDADASDLSDPGKPETWTGETVEAPQPAGQGLERTSMRYLGGIRLADGEEKLHDFGMIRAGESREHVFQFISDGKEALVIRGVKPSCGCTKAEVLVQDESGEWVPYEKGTEIPTGKEFRLDTEISSEGKHGSIGATVSVYTNAPGGSFNVRLAAEVEPVLDVEPETAVYLGQMTVADQKEETITISSHRGELFRLTADLSGLQKIQVDLEPVDPDEEGRAAVWKAHIIAGPGLPLGIRSEPCLLTSDLPIADPRYAAPEGEVKYHTVPLSIQARVTGLVHAEPAFVGFGMVRPAQVIQRSVRIQSHDDYKLKADTPVTFEGLYGGEFEYADRFEVSGQVSEDGKYLDLTVTLTGLPEDLNGSFGGIMQVHVGHPATETLPVRFSGVCRALLPGSGGN
ncbi:MAG TPA: DUF1573 domain-containing protein [Planctomycetes bacterium]|nr:DUF1573 domain-containing protein [Planctomycetota bacterium]